MGPCPCPAEADREAPNVKTYPASRDATGLRVAVVVSRFNPLISARLLEGSEREFLRRGCRAEDIHVAWVPGAFEIPLAARELADSERYDAIVTLGSVIRGGTPHFEYVCQGVTEGVAAVMRDTRVPVAFGVLTLDDIDQALDRTGGAHGHKGEEAALAAIEMARLREQLGKAPE
ncbi:MAG: 6,7-dimethyl-8-ribityllumazine synthase [Deltaproteobacteria bacterium]|nr:6,7-dimethyl-8-ribityllumazine synthase [Deltaproteobacteria bacterium]